VASSKAIEEFETDEIAEHPAVAVRRSRLLSRLDQALRVLDR
jgi:hypothetical protein